MSDPFIIPSRLHSPYFIFIRCAGEYSDADLLRRFGLGGYKRTKDAPDLGRYTLVADDGTWTMIADDWFYTLWTMKSTRKVIAEFGLNYDVYACSVGDCDRSFDFVWYAGGKLKRKYVVQNPTMTRPPEIVENRGQPLPGEAEALQREDEMDKVLDIAATLGIQIQTSGKNVRIYAAPSETVSKLYSWAMKFGFRR